MIPNRHRADEEFGGKLLRVPDRASDKELDGRRQLRTLQCSREDAERGAVRIPGFLPALLVLPLVLHGQAH